VSNTLCFAMRMGRQYVLGVLDLNSSSPQTKIVTNAAGDWEAPSWAPDGRHVVCSHSAGGRRGLCMVDTWYGRIIPITQPQDHSLPSWSDLF
jgi:Tol biopolymer transport system component